MDKVSDTPRTDRVQKFTPIGTVWLNHAKDLERELAAQKEQLQDAMLQLQILQGKLDASERLNKPPTKLLVIPELLRQAGWMPIPKPLTDEIIDDIFRKVMNKHAYITEGLIELRREYARAVERAHGIGEKE
jgi:hypothetical protein